ncbi:MAG TPA: hypothetical protein VFE14_02780 [Micromonosporaceae bacterium]|nr:hypothetical protein [Micromonosporaceae bacterium]
MPLVPALAWARLRHRPARWLLVCLGVAAATMLPVLAEGSAGLVAGQALRHGIEQLAPGQRSLIVSFPGLRLGDDELAQMDHAVRDRLAALAAGPTRAELLFRRIADPSGGTYFLGAADELSSAVRITEGRAPASCTPQRCEVVVMGDGDPRLDPALGIVVVGRAVRTDPLLLTGTFDPGHDAPLLLADGVDKAQQLASLETFGRSYGWVTPIDLDRVGALGVDGYLARSADVHDNLWRIKPGLVLTAPDDVLRAEDARARRSSRRFALLGGAATALLLGFAAIGAIGLRRDHAAVTELLRRRGARRGVQHTLTAIESATPVILGTLAGLVAAGAVVAARAAGAGLPGWPSTVDALGAAAVPVAIGALAAGVVVAVTRAWPATAASGTAWRAVDVTVLAGLAVAGLALARGTVSAANLDERTDPLLLALPVIAVVCGGLLVGRAWPVLTAAVARLLPHGWLAPRLGLLGALRRPLRPVATAAFLAAATGIVVFAGAYQATLRQGAVDQAGFAVPLDARVSTGPNLERPLEVAAPEKFAAAAPGVSVHPALRTGAGVPINAAESLGADVIGVDPAALPLIRSWADIAGPADPQAIARLITVPVPTPAGVEVPDGARTLAIPATGDAEPVTVTAWLRAGDGRDAGLALRADGGRLVAELPALPAPVRLFALTLAESQDYATHHQHRIGEGGIETQALAGTLRLGAPAFDAHPAAGAWAGWQSTGAKVDAGASGLAISYAFAGARIVVRAGSAAAAPVLPVLADPVTAARAAAGTLQLVVNANAPFTAQVVGVLPRFPTAGTRFIVADVHALADALDAREPGTGSIAELWLWAPDGQQATLTGALTAAPYDRLRVDLRQVRQDQLASDPLARGAAGLLTSSAVLALLVGLVALVLLVVAERRDESAELYAWESDGVAPGTLRMSLFARAAAIVGIGVPGGLAVGLVLSAVTTRLVTLTAVGTAPTPPLTLSVGAGWIATVLAAAVVVGLAAAGSVAGASLRESLPRRPEEVYS